MAKYDSFLGQKDGLKFKSVTEPTDIIWENRSVTRTTRLTRRIISYIAILLMLTLSGLAIFKLQITSLALKLKYPPKDCLSEGKGFMFTEYNGKSLADRLEPIRKDAIKEYQRALEHKSRQIKEDHPGYLQCYCDYLSKSKNEKLLA